MTNLAKQILRPSDSFARFGGEEFCILLPETNRNEAVQIAERLQSAINQLNMRDDADNLISFHISQGVASWHQHETAIEHLLNRADQALYVAKNAGRNCIRTASLQVSAPENDCLNHQSPPHNKSV